MKLHKEIPGWWINTLREVQEQYASAILAGGCLRDLILERPVKDLDIIVGVGRDIVLSDCIDIAEPRSASAGSTLVSQAIFTGRELPINIIYINPQVPPIERADNNDFGFCRIAFDGQELRLHDDFIHDMEHEQITLRRCWSWNDLNSSMRRYNRLKRKYNWPLVILPELDLEHLDPYTEEGNKA